MKKSDYNNFTKLYVKQDWLFNKVHEIEELISFCDNNESKELIFNLLDRFSYLKYSSYNHLLKEIVDFIINQSGFGQFTTQLLALTRGSEPDSSQKVLDNIKNPLFNTGWRNHKLVNNFDLGFEFYTQGYTQIILIDEFIGSGKTLTNRIKILNNVMPGAFTLKCCFIAGIKEVIDNLVNNEIDIFCPLQLDRGISGHYTGEEFTQAVLLMKNLELKLATKINKKRLSTFSFGYGRAEALYTLEGCNGNTPNSVFPIFWWPKTANGYYRNHLLTRVESGF